MRMEQLKRLNRAQEFLQQRELLCMKDLKALRHQITLHRILQSFKQTQQLQIVNLEKRRLLLRVKILNRLPKRLRQQHPWPLARLQPGLREIALKM
jgi:hypothetical protein